MNFLNVSFDILDFFFLPVLFFIGTVTCYEDIRFCLVRNKWIKLGFFWGVGILLFLLVFSFFSKEVSQFFFKQLFGRKDQKIQLTISSSYLLKQLINAFLSFGVGFIMWKKRIWAAGDAKLFFIFSLLLPLKYYQRSYLFIFPSLALLVNIFFPIFIFFSLGGALFYSKKLLKKLLNRKKSFLTNLFFKKQVNEKEKERKKTFNRKSFFKKISFLKNMLIMLLIFMAIQLAPNGFFRKYFLIDVSYVQAIFIICLVIFQKKFFNLISKPLVVLIIFLIFLFSYSKSSIWLNSKETLFFAGKMFLTFAVFMFIFSFFNRAVNIYLNKKGVKTINSKDLRKGMFIEKELMEKIRENQMLKSKFKKTYLEGLNCEQTLLLKNWLVENKINKIKIYTTFPFVFWMFLGVLLTIFFKGSVLSEILKLIFKN